MARPAGLTRLLDQVPAPTDDALLARFADDADEEAFAALVRRHGPMVLGVCRRVLPDQADADDAFQATFVVLARKAKRVAGRVPLGGWLYGVARRAALQARAAAARRKRVEATAARPEAVPPPDSSDWLVVIEEELGRLPDRYRLPLVLCGVCGQPRRNAAGQLGIPEGTLASRLATARALLADRLRRRGVAVPGGLMAVAVPVISSEQVAAATQAAAGMVPAGVAKLASGVIRAMFLNKYRVAVLIIPVALLAAVAAGSDPRPRAVDPPTPAVVPQPVPKRVPVAPAKAEGRLLVLHEGKLTFYSPDGKPDAELKTDQPSLHDHAVSPDGKRVAFIADERPPLDKDGNYCRHVLVRDIDGKSEGVKAEVVAQNILWTPDGKLVAVEAASFKDVRDRKFTTWLIDGKGKTCLDLPEGAQVFGVTPDGKTYLAVTAADKKLHLSAITRDGKATELVETARLPGPFAKPRLSPDGSRVLYLDVDADEKPEKGRLRFPRLFVYDLTAKKRERMADVPLDAFVQSFAWSPDSKRVAYSWKRMEPGVPVVNNLDDLKNPKPPTETESHLTVSDAGGSNAKTILTAKGASGPAVTLSDLDWR